MESTGPCWYTKLELEICLVNFEILRCQLELLRTCDTTVLAADLPSQVKRGWHLRGKNRDELLKQPLLHELKQFDVSFNYPLLRDEDVVEFLHLEDRYPDATRAILSQIAKIEDRLLTVSQYRFVLEEVSAPVIMQLRITGPGFWRPTCCSGEMYDDGYFPLGDWEGLQSREPDDKIFFSFSPDRLVESYRS